MLDTVDDVLKRNIITGLTVVIVLVGLGIVATGGDLEAYKDFVSNTWPLIVGVGVAKVANNAVSNGVTKKKKK